MSSNIKVQRICQHCGADFTARTTVTRYCGDVCAKRAYKVRKRDEKVDQSDQETIKVKYKPIEDLKKKEYLTVRDVSVLLGCSLQTVYRLVNNGTLSAVNLSERMTRIKKSDLDKLLS